MIENEITTTTTVIYNQIIGTITTILVIYILLTVLHKNVFQFQERLPYDTLANILWSYRSFRRTSALFLRA
jgi:hypothetical protein